ncbi:MAG: citryl-CoA lyase, partial [Gammaproteobacteria bacterium]|nr:citryl-CoA lyase [Gammaproteobacteria bacterium]
MSKLEQSEDRWVTRMGAWFPGDRVVFRGQDLHADLGNATWMDVYLYGILGRRFNESELKLINAMWVMTSFPDPRLWNNRVAALAGTVRSTGTLSIAAAIAVSEATLYGGQPVIRALDFFQRAKKEVEAGGNLNNFAITELRQLRSIGG